MAVSFNHGRSPAPLLVSDHSAQIAKGALRKAEHDEPDPERVKLGACMRKVQHDFVLTLKEFARELGKDERQIERQMEGKERPQIELLLSHPKFQGPMLIALANSTPGVEVDTVIHIRRSSGDAR